MKRLREGAFLGVVAISAAAVFTLVWTMPMASSLQPNGDTATAATAADIRGEPIDGCRVTDGDTLRCGSERIRLLGIDAPELPGHCREGRACAPGDPFESTESLRRALTGDVTIQRITTDRYGRTIALVAGAKGDLSCWQLRNLQAIYREDWDNDGRVKATCRDATVRTVR